LLVASDGYRGRGPRDGVDLLAPKAKFEVAAILMFLDLDYMVAFWAIARQTNLFVTGIYQYPKPLADTVKIDTTCL
jgi:hypothetical protein